MLARLTLILLAIPALALAADGDAVKSSAMRLPVVQKASTAPTVTPSKMTPLAPIVTPTDPGECRTSCAQTYYFCRAGDQTDECAGNWGQCVATCDSPNLARNFSTAP